MTKRNARHAFMLGAALAAVTAIAPAAAQNKADGKDMNLAGWSDLQGRSAYQPLVHEQNGRWIAYIGHHGGTPTVPQPVNPLTGQAENNGTSILDVTDPKNPKYLHHIPGDQGNYEDGGAQMVRVCDGKTLPKGDPNKVYLLRTFGNAGHQVFDVTDPAKPVKLSEIMGLHGTHKNWWECDTGIAYLVSGVHDWRVHRMTMIYDLSDPAKPVKIREFGLVGQQPGSTGDVPTMLHGPVSTGPRGNRVYFGYGTNSGGVLQIVDREKLLNGPKEPTPENLLYPQVGRLDMMPWNGAHTVFPMLGVELPQFAHDKVGRVRDFIVLTDEAIKNVCDEARQMVWIVDISVESRPWPVSSWTADETAENYCARGGRFGTHSSHENFTPIYYKRLMFFAHFNGGVRVVDVRDPYHPKEVGFYVPATTDKTDKRCVKVGDKEECKIAIQTNNVEVDDRGLIFAVDRANTGMHILELTGEARKIGNFPD
ncbi:MAG: hypothetical protein HY060_17255 [Proteobacteria bacterium]|nr:hypothetical protein [Pseudomonadota bacterium]